MSQRPCTMDAKSLSSSTIPPLVRLPLEIQYLILEQADFEQYPRLQKVCRSWYLFIENVLPLGRYTPVFWKADPRDKIWEEAEERTSPYLMHKALSIFTAVRTKKVIMQAYPRCGTFNEPNGKGEVPTGAGSNNPGRSNNRPNLVNEMKIFCYERDISHFLSDPVFVRNPIAERCGARRTEQIVHCSDCPLNGGAVGRLTWKKDGEGEFFTVRDWLTRLEAKAVGQSTIPAETSMTPSMNVEEDGHTSQFRSWIRCDRRRCVEYNERVEEDVRIEEYVLVGRVSAYRCSQSGEQDAAKSAFERALGFQLENMPRSVAVN
ncbi:hypothetical protein ABW19_dt0206015 [Dactylella cylindrospora]|nr:hypothetical protein ABW19_dt0206015 [Dactylella cylindrospora]